MTARTNANRAAAGKMLADRYASMPGLGDAHDSTATVIDAIADLLHYHESLRCQGRNDARYTTEACYHLAWDHFTAELTGCKGYLDR